MQHPDITWIELTGYPYRMQRREDPDEDAAYEEQREKEMFGDDLDKQG